MIDFNKKIVTADGRKVRIYATDSGGPRPIHGAVFIDSMLGWEVKSWEGDGYYPSNKRLCLRNEPEQREVWINVYSDRSFTHSTEKEANTFSTPDRLKCICLKYEV